MFLLEASEPIGLCNPKFQVDIETTLGSLDYERGLAILGPNSPLDSTNIAQLYDKWSTLALINPRIVLYQILAQITL